ncbi:hypothetical protein QUF75_20030 [Desulfococcaceae bacterium HSG7]|nr:hypothetical protein [Desulfococcaceae bacterium HSG7]
MENYIGIDISKNTFDVHHTTDQCIECFDNIDIHITTFTDRSGNELIRLLTKVKNLNGKLKFLPPLWATAGAETVGMLIGSLPELGYLSRRKIAALVGRPGTDQ